MHPVRKQRLFVVLGIVIASSLVIGLGLYAMKGMGDFFYPVSKIVNGEAPLNTGTIVSAKDELRYEFVITDGSEKVSVHYEGVLPDIFGDGEAAVITGKLGEDGILVASQVLAKHDENYVPPEVAESMSDTEKHNEACKGMNMGGDYGS